jgi:hypothetical protein
VKSTETIFVWVPAPGAEHKFRPGSAIVSFAPGPDGLADCYLQDECGAANIRTYADRVEQAAGRMIESYPTVARIAVPVTELELVGFWSGERGEVFCELPGPLAAWLGRDVLDPAELQSSSAYHEQLRQLEQLRAGSAQERMLAQWWARRLGLNS